MSLDQLKEFRDSRSSEATFARLAAENGGPEQDPLGVVTDITSRLAAR